MSGRTAAARAGRAAQAGRGSSAAESSGARRPANYGSVCSSGPSPASLLAGLHAVVATAVPGRLEPVLELRSRRELAASGRAAVKLAGDGNHPVVHIAHEDAVRWERGLGDDPAGGCFDRGACKRRDPVQGSLKPKGVRWKIHRPSCGQFHRMIDNGDGYRSSMADLSRSGRSRLPVGLPQVPRFRSRRWGVSTVAPERGGGV